MPILPMPSAGSPSGSLHGSRSATHARLEEHGFRPENTNPCRRIKKYRANRRERYLTSEEFARLGRILDRVEGGAENVFAVVAIRLLLLTGARLMEILTLRWSYVDLERGLLLLPDSKTSQKSIRLGEAAIAVLQAVPRVKENPYVIVGRKDGAHIVHLQKTWRRIRAAAGLNDGRNHDLRHSFASMAAASGASLPMIGKLLGHTQPQTTARYAHLADDPLHQLNQKVGNLISKAMRGRDQT